MTRLPKGTASPSWIPPRSVNGVPGTLITPLGPAWATSRRLLVPLTALVAFNGSTLAPRAREKTSHNQGTERTRRRRRARRKAEKR